jgi:hypothetical protein
MIKINLLNSVTERQGSTVMAVDRKVGSAGSRLLLLTLTVGFLLGGGDRLGRHQYADGISRRGTPL